MRRCQPDSGVAEHLSSHHGSARDTNRARPLVRLRPDCCPGGQVLRRAGFVPRRSALRQPQLDSTNRHPRPRTRRRRLPSRLAPGGPRQGPRQPPARPRRRGPARRETPSPGLPPPSPEAAERVWTQLQPGWRYSKHRRDWLTILTRYAFPSLGKQPVSEITSADVLDTLRPIWHTQPDMARRVRQRIRALMEWAIVMQYRADNPCDRLGPALGRQQVIVQHMRALAPCPGRGGAAGAYHARGQARF